MRVTLFSRHLFIMRRPAWHNDWDISKKCTHSLNLKPTLFKKCNLYPVTLLGLNMKSVLCLLFHSEGHWSLPYQNLSMKSSYNIDNVMFLLNDIFQLKDAKATSLVVENKLRSLYFYYNNLKKEEKEEFLKELASKHSVNHDAIVKVSKQLGELEPNSALMLKTEDKLRELLIPQYAWLFSHLGRLDQGVKFLVDLRCDILSLLSSTDAKSPHQVALQQLNITLRELLTLWFSLGFLKIERVTWSSSCALLQKISEYEAVHPMRNWADIKQRVGPYRRCFVYTHYNMPEEPLVVLHVALTKDISNSVKDIIQITPETNNGAVSQNNIVQEEQHNVKAFIFYSISATQKGLQGIDLGNYMIKRASKELHSEYPQATKFSSLSPIPTFCQWLVEKMKTAEKGDKMFPPREWEEILNSLNPENKIDAWAKLRSMLLDNSWFHNETFVKTLEAPLMASCSRYLYLEKRRGYAFDSVANFHLRNGAVMWRLNWLADTSPRGLTNSCGLMVNYRYYLDAADSNSLKYIQERSIEVSEQIMKLATGSSI